MIPSETEYSLSRFLDELIGLRLKIIELERDRDDYKWRYESDSRRYNNVYLENLRLQEELRKLTEFKDSPWEKYI